MNNIKYIVTAVDKNDCSDERPETLGEFNTREEAEEYVRQDMRGYCDNYTFVDDETGQTVGPRVYDEEGMFIENFDGSGSCSWKITATERT